MEKSHKFFSFIIPALFIIGLSAGMTYLSAEQNPFQQKCAKCHALKDPDKYTRQEWKYNVERMAQRAKLTPEEIKSIIELNKKE